MDQRQRMLAGLPYKAWLDGLEEDRLLCKKRIYEFNLLPPDSRSLIPEKLKTILDAGKVTIGDNAVIGAGSVVAKNIPANMFAVGNPCRVIREITEQDRIYYFKDKTFDRESWAEISKREVIK